MPDAFTRMAELDARPPMPRWKIQHGHTFDCLGVGAQLDLTIADINLQVHVVAVEDNPDGRMLTVEQRRTDDPQPTR